MFFLILIYILALRLSQKNPIWIYLDHYRTGSNLFVKNLFGFFFTIQISNILRNFVLSQSIYWIELDKNHLKKIIQSTEFQLHPTDPPIQYTEFEFSEK